MISFVEAYERIMRHVPVQGMESCRLADAAGRILRRCVCADRALPPYDRVMMDGYAVKSNDFLVGRLFRVVGETAAGMSHAALPEKGGVCMEVMTGAMMPAGADCIIPVEYTRGLEDNLILVLEDFCPVPRRFIHECGSDAAEGEVLLRDGVMLGGREIGVAASCGMAELMVSKMPTIAVQPTGDELVDLTANPEIYQIRQSNGHALRAGLQRAGFAATVLPTLGDNAQAEQLEAALQQYDWLVVTGAVSKGRRDFIPGLLGKMGCEKLFHGIAQRPGKPAGAWLGRGGQVILALPGNPVSAIVGLHTLCLPALGKAMGREALSRQKVALAEPFAPLPGMTLHLPVKIEADGRARAVPVGNSGDYIGLLRSDGFITMDPQGSKQREYFYQSWQ